MISISDTPPTHDIQGISSITTSTAVSADRSPSSLPPAQDVAPPARKPWTTPTVTEISIDDLPTELRMMALGLPVPDRPEDSTWRKLPAQAVVRG